MKKIYITPTAEVVKFNRVTLLAGSPALSNENADVDVDKNYENILSRDFDFDE